MNDSQAAEKPASEENLNRHVAMIIVQNDPDSSPKILLGAFASWRFFFINLLVEFMGREVMQHSGR